MFNEYLELFKLPVTSLKKRAQEKNVKKEAITGAIIAVILAIVTLITTYNGAMKPVKKKYSSLKEYNDKYSYFGSITEEDFKEKKKEAKKDALENINFAKTFFSTFAISAVSILLVAGILFIIARMVKIPKDYIELIAMTNGASIMYVLGFLINVIFSYIYAPVGMILFVGISMYALISLCNAFRDLLEVKDSDKLSMYSSIVLTIVFTILVIIVAKYIDTMFSGMTNILSLF